MLQAWKTPSLLIYAAVRRVGPGGHALPPASVFPSLEVVPVSQDVWAWRYARPHQPLLSHLRAMLPRMPSRIPGPGDIVAIDAEFVATSTQEVRCWQRHSVVATSFFPHLPVHPSVKPVACTSCCFADVT